MRKDNFIKVPFRHSNADRYVVRTSLLKAVKKATVLLHGKMLDAGCGKMPYREYIVSQGKVTEYIGLDIESARTYDAGVKPDFTWDGTTMPFDNHSFDSALATEVLEHCPEPEVFLREVLRVMKPGGEFFFTVPFLWNLHEVPYDEYRYTPFSLQRHLASSGFTDIRIHALGGWHAGLAQMLGLWVRRAPMPGFFRTMLSLFFMPLIYILYRMDSPDKVKFTEGAMITGLYGSAKKAGKSSSHPGDTAS
jgi:SAM-dependent methyltransferase